MNSVSVQLVAIVDHARAEHILLRAAIEATRDVCDAAQSRIRVFRGERPVLDWIAGFLVPAFIGNSIGGVGLVAALAHVQHAPDE